MIWVSVAMGGALGACLRYALFLSIGTVGGFPLATFVANAGGSLALGLLAALFRLGESGPMSWDSPLRLFLLVGVLGALTTFSTFALEAVDALRAGRVGLALLYVSVTLVITLVGCWIGYLVGQGLGRRALFQSSPKIDSKFVQAIKESRNIDITFFVV